MRVLVTGCAGLIGSWVAEALLKEKEVELVIGIDDLSGGEIENVTAIQDNDYKKRYRFFQFDIGNQRRLDEIFRAHRPDVVVHAAACAREGASAFQPVKIAYSNNYISTILLETAIKYKTKRFVFFSSMSVMGDQEVPFIETQPRMPVDVYGISKAATEETLKSLAKVHDIEYNILRPHNCYDKETEILTKDRGFVFFSELTFDDYLATLNPKTNELEWHKPEDIQIIPYSGDMIHFTPKGVDLLVTPDHHLWMKRKGDNFRFIRADDVDDMDYLSEFIGGANWKGEDQEFKILPECKDKIERSDSRNPERKIPINSWLKLMGWFISEGSVFATPSNYTVVITNYNKENKEEIREVIRECGYSPYECDHRDIKIHSKQLYKELIGMAGSQNKKIPQELKNLPPERLNILFTTLLKGDGTFTHKGTPSGYKTISRKLADDIEEIGTKLGYRVSHSIYQYFGNPSAKPCYCISFASKQTTPQLGNNISKKIYANKITYNDIVYDVTVPNHIILIRRNGKIIWSGNCFGERVSLTDPYRNVIAIFANRLMRRESIYVFGQQTIRALSYLEDSIPAFISAIKGKVKNEIIFIGGKEPITIETLLDAVIEDFAPDYKPEIIHLPLRPLEVHEAWCSIEKSVKLLNYDEKTGWREGVRRTINWAKKKGPQQWRVDDLPLINGKTPKPWLELESR